MRVRLASAPMQSRSARIWRRTGTNTGVVPSSVDMPWLEFPCLSWSPGIPPSAKLVFSTERVNALVKIDHLAAKQGCIMWR
jgi:hypothetical protein